MSRKIWGPAQSVSLHRQHWQFGIPKLPVHVSTKGKINRAWRCSGRPRSRFFQKFAVFGQCGRLHYYHLHLPRPRGDRLHADASLNLPRKTASKVRSLRCIFVTPADRGYTIDHWMHIRMLAVRSMRVICADDLRCSDRFVPRQGGARSCSSRNSVPQKTQTHSACHRTKARPIRKRIRDSD